MTSVNDDSKNNRLDKNQLDKPLAQDKMTATVDEATLNDKQRKAFIRENYDSPLDDRSIVGKLELLEERAVVNKERLDVGKVVASKHIRTKTVNVPIELVEEVLTITTEYYDADSEALLTGEYDDKETIRHISPTLDSQTTISVNGQKITLGNEPVEVVLSRQVAIINKETHVVQEVAIEKSVHTHTDTIDVELKREELDVVEEGLLHHDSEGTK